MYYQTEAWWRRGNTLASHHYDLGLTLSPGRMWDVFHPSQPIPGGFPLGVFFHPQKGSKLFCLELSHKAVLGDIKSVALPFTMPISLHSIIHCVGVNNLNTY